MNQLKICLILSTIEGIFYTIKLTLENVKDFFAPATPSDPQVPALRPKCILHWKQSGAKPLLHLSCPTSRVVRCDIPHIYPRVELHCKLSAQGHAPLLCI